MHHRLGYDVPERTGFGGLWSAMEGRRDEPSTTVAAPRTVVARSEGATRASVRSSIAAFLAATAPADDVAA